MLKNLLFCFDYKCFIALLTLATSIHLVQAQSYTVNIVPIGKVSHEHLNLVQSSLKDYYNVEVHLRDSIEIKPEFITKFDTILNADAINAYLHKQANDSTQKWIGVTDWHITIGNILPKLIRGFTEKVGGNCAVVSSSKVLLETKADARPTFRSLYSRVVKHEFGHLIGLEHCSNSEACLMVSGPFFLEAQDELCELCKSKIGIDVVKIH